MRRHSIVTDSHPGIRERRELSIHVVMNEKSCMVLLNY